MFLKRPSSNNSTGNTLDENLWKAVFTFLQPSDFKSALLTCKMWGRYGSNDLALRDAVLQNLTQIPNISKGNKPCVTQMLRPKSTVPTRAPGNVAI